MDHSFSMHDLPATERPRERLQHLGAAVLSLQELLAIILGRGVKNQPVSAVAGKILALYPSLPGLAEASLADLQGIKGLGQAKASQLVACFELAKRLDSGGPTDAISGGNNPAIIARLVRSQIKQPKKEHYFVVSLDARSQIVGVDQVSVGTLNANLVHPRETFDAAIRRHASHIIVCHNHPSGDIDPSDEDLAVTQRLITAGKIIGIAVVDHVIITAKIYFSFRERNLL